MGIELYGGEVGTLTWDGSQFTSDTGTFDFDDENLTTTGTGTFNSIIETTPTLLKLDQTTAQTIINGVPLLDTTPNGAADIKSFVNKEYVDFAVTSLGASYYMHDEDDATGYKTCYLNPSSDAEAYIEAANLADDDYIGGWISASGEAPTKLLKGIYDWYITLEKTTGTKDLRVYWELIERKSDNSEVVIATSSNSNIVTDKATYLVPLQLSGDYIPDSGSRIVGKLYADVSGGGGAPTVRAYYQGNTSSRWEIPANSEIFQNIFVPYEGAVKDIDLGAHNLTTTGTLTAGAATFDSTLALASGSITDITGAISFGDENLTTTGTGTFGTITDTSINGTQIVYSDNNRLAGDTSFNIVKTSNIDLGQVAGVEWNPKKAGGEDWGATNIVSVLCSGDDNLFIGLSGGADNALVYSFANTLVSAVKVYWIEGDGSSPPLDYYFQYWNGSEWVTPDEWAIAATAGSQEFNTLYTFTLGAPVLTTKVRLYKPAGGGGTGIGLSRFEVWGDYTTLSVTKITAQHLDLAGVYLSKGLQQSGAGTRLIWDSGVFRAGEVTGTQWDLANVGRGSFAGGLDTTASGRYSVAFGKNTEASGYGSIAMGSDTVASENYAVAMGRDAVANGAGAVAIGIENDASGTNSISMGLRTNASGGTSVAMGSGTTASGQATVSMGLGTTASGDFSTAMGWYSKAESYASVAIGKFNIGGGSATSWVATDPLFEIGIGTSSFSRANALTVYKNGNIELAGNLTTTGTLTAGAATFDSTLMFASGSITDTTGAISFGDDNLSTSGTLTSGAATIDSTLALASGSITDSTGTIDFDNENLTTTGTGSFGNILNSDYILSTGTFGSGWTETDLGAGTRLLWYPRKAAFRAGGVTGTEWDDAAIGSYSAAFGWNTAASGDYSFAAGIGTTGSGDYSVAMGWGTVASGDHGSVAMGGNTTASGNYSVAMGEVTTASGYASVAMGGNTTASGNYSVAMGHSTVASGGYSFAIGDSTEVIGSYSVAMGYQTHGSGDYSVAMGSAAIASGDYSFAVGYETTASGNYSTAMGYGVSGSGDYSVAIGYSASAGGRNSVAMGYSTSAAGISSFSAGNATLADGSASVALGSGSIASGSGSVVMGYDTKATGTGSIALGHNNNYNSTSFVAGTGTANEGSGQIAMGYASWGNTLKAEGTGSIAMGQDVSALTNDNVIVIGKSFTNNTASSFAVGFGRKNLTVTDGTITIAATEDLSFDMTGATADTIVLSSTTGASTLDFSAFDLKIGKVDASGGVDPPYVLYDPQTRQETIDIIGEEVPLGKQNGAALYFNKETNKLEVYFAKENRFFELGMYEIELKEDGTLEGTLPDLTKEENIFIQKIKQALSYIGLVVENGVAKMREVVTEKLTTKTARMDRIEMVDQETGEVYCTWIENGEWVKVESSCDELTNPDDQNNPGDGPIPEPTPEPTPEPQAPEEPEPEEPEEPQQPQAPEEPEPEEPEEPQQPQALSNLKPQKNQNQKSQKSLSNLKPQKNQNQKSQKSLSNP